MVDDKEVLRLRRLGYTQKEVAVLLKVSLRTIKRHDKSKEVDEDFGENAEFEDEEEGWVFHYTKDILASTPESKSWNFIGYLDSAPSGWIEELEKTNLPFMIALHDKDIWLSDSKKGLYKKGDLKKIHIHGNVKFPKPITLKKAAMIIQRITNGPIPKVCDDEFGLIKYVQHLHKDGTPIEGKTVYSPDIIKYYNGWEPELASLDIKRMEQELEQFLIGLTTNYAKAVHKVNQVLGREYGFLMRKSSYHYRSIIDSNRGLSEAEKNQITRELADEFLENVEAEVHWRNYKKQETENQLVESNEVQQ